MVEDKQKDIISETQIVYFDSDLHKTNISGISEEDLSRCVSVIKESNPDVDINLIQYSKGSRRVTFYAKMPISIAKWENEKQTQIKPITSSVGVLEEIKKLINPSIEENNTMVSLDDNDTIIPLADVLSLLRETYNEHKELKDYYEKEASSKYAIVSNNSSYVFIRDFDYTSNKLEVGFSPYSFSNWIYYHFYKKDGDLIAQKEKNGRAEDKGVVAISETILKLVDDLEKYRGFNMQKATDIPTVNSRFVVNIDRYGIELSTPTRFFSLDAKSYKEEYDYECNSHNIASVIKDNENEIYSKVLVRIKDCPEWMHAKLYERRETSIAQARQKQEEQAKAEAKKQKRIEFRNRIFPFLKEKGR